MKKIIFLLCSGFFLKNSFAQPAQTSLDPSQVPPAAVSSFTSNNPGTNATWKLDPPHYRVNFIDPATKLSRIIIYDKDGNVIRRENEVDNMTFPAGIKEYYDKHHPGENFQVWSGEDKRSGKPIYYSNRNDETIWFDANGKVIPERKVGKTEKEK